MSRFPTRKDILADPLLQWWNIGAVVSFLLPLMIMSISRLSNRAEGNNNNNYNFYYNYNNNQGGDGDGDGGGEGEDDQMQEYWWRNQRNEEIEGRGKAAITITYLWVLVMFIALILYGNIVLKRNSEFVVLQATIVMFANFAFVIMILLSGLGAINNEGNDMEEDGFYGQISVCFFLSCLFWVFHAIIFSVQIKKRKRQQIVEQEEDSSYFNPEVITTKVTKDIEKVFEGF